LAIIGDHKNVEPIRMLIVKITELEKLQENRLEAQNNVGVNWWNRPGCSAALRLDQKLALQGRAQK
jgi:hypothetical protein